MRRALFVLALASLLAGDVFGSENAAFVVSGSVGGSNGESKIALNTTDDEYLVAWFNSSQKKIYVRVVDSTGAVAGLPVAITSKAAGAVLSVAYNSAANEYLVAWETYSNGKASNTLYTQRVSADGKPVGNPTKVAGESKKLNWHPSIVYNPDDDLYLVVWSKEGLTTADGGNFSQTTDGLYARFMDSAGKAVGNEILVKAMSYERADNYLYHLGYQGYVVRWQPTKKRYGILANHILSPQKDIQIEFMATSSSGALVAGPVKVNRKGVDTGSVNTALCLNSTSGQWLALWEDYAELSGSDTAEIDQRMLNTSGNPAGNEAKMFDNDQTSGGPVAAFDPNKGNFFVVFWADELDGGTNINVRGQFIGGSGALGKSVSIASSKEAEAEQYAVYDSVSKKYFVVYSLATGQGKLVVYGLFIAPQ